MADQPVLPPKGFFANTEKAALSRRGQRMTPGTYILKIDRVRYRQTERTFKYFVEIVVQVVATLEDPTGKALVPGTEATISIWKSSQFFDKEMKSFVYCAFDCTSLVDQEQFYAEARQELAAVRGTPAQIQALAEQKIAGAAEEIYMAVVNEDQNPLGGNLVLVTCAESKTEAPEGKERFVNTKWVKRVYYAELQRLLGEKFASLINNDRGAVMSEATFQEGVSREQEA